MGWLPIALALAGFVFFVVIVNYNSIKVHEEAITLAYLNFCQTAKARHTLLISLQDIANKSNPPAFMAQDFHLKRYPEYLKGMREELQSIEETQIFLRINQRAPRETRNKLKSLQVLNHRQQIYIRVFSRKVREYNNLVSSYPTAMVARASGRKPLKA